MVAETSSDIKHVSCLDAKDAKSIDVDFNNLKQKLKVSRGWTHMNRWLK